MKKHGGHVLLRRSILDDIERGYFTALMFSVYMVIVLQADPDSGVWIGSAEKISVSLPSDRHDSRSFRQALNLLEERGYLRRYRVKGRKGFYPILVSDYFCADTAPTGKLLNISKSIDCNNPCYDPCREVVVDAVPEITSRPPRDCT